MTLTSNTPNPVRPIGSVVDLTCIVHIMELGSAFDVAVMLNIVWTGPDEFTTINSSQPALASSTTYTSRVVVSSFGRNESGNYTCTASLSSSSANLYLSNSSAISDTIRVTTGET